MTSSPASSPQRRLSSFFASLTARQKWLGAGAALVALLFLAQYGPLTVRGVSINGYRLNEQELAYVEQSLGVKVPNGDYWFDPPPPP